MGGDDSQKLLPRRGTYSSRGRSKPPAFSNINALAQRRLLRAVVPALLGLEVAISFRIDDLAQHRFRATQPRSGIGPQSAT